MSIERYGTAVGIITQHPPSSSLCRDNGGIRTKAESRTLTVAQKKLRPNSVLDRNRRPQPVDHSGRTGGPR